MLGKASGSTFHGIEKGVETTQAYGSRPTKNGQWSESALRVLKERYLMRDATGVQGDAGGDVLACCGSHRQG